MNNYLNKGLYATLILLAVIIMITGKDLPKWLKVIQNIEFFEDDISIVKNYKPFQGELTTEQTFNMLAGITGTIEWQKIDLKDEQLNNVGAVQVVIKRKDTKLNCKNIKVKYLVNRTTKEVKVDYAEIDGEETNAVGIEFISRLVISLEPLLE